MEVIRDLSGNDLTAVADPSGAVWRRIPELHHWYEGLSDAAGPLAHLMHSEGLPVFLVTPSSTGEDRSFSPGPETDAALLVFHNHGDEFRGHAGVAGYVRQDTGEAAADAARNLYADFTGRMQRLWDARIDSILDRAQAVRRPISCVRLDRAQGVRRPISCVRTLRVPGRRPVTANGISSPFVPEQMVAALVMQAAPVGSSLTIRPSEAAPGDEYLKVHRLVYLRRVAGEARWIEHTLGREGGPAQSHRDFDHPDEWRPTLAQRAADRVARRRLIRQAPVREGLVTTPPAGVMPPEVQNLLRSL